MVPSTEWNQTLERTRNKLAAWRQRNKPPKPIPADIWKTAVELSHQLGLGTVARELKLDHGSLKRRAAEPLTLSLGPWNFSSFWPSPWA